MTGVARPLGWESTFSIPGGVNTLAAARAAHPERFSTERLLPKILLNRRHRTLHVRVSSQQDPGRVRGDLLRLLSGTATPVICGIRMSETITQNGSSGSASSRSASTVRWW